MKVILILALLTVSYCHFPLSKEIREEQVSDDIINAINSDPTSTWKAGINEKFRDITVGEFQTYLGAYLSPYEDIKDLIVVHQGLYGDEDIPESYDLREKYPNCSSLTEVRDQSTCGSCWAFSATESMSDRICIRTGQNIRISSEDLLTCCISCGNGCKGGFPVSAFKYFNSNGIVTGDLYDDKKFCQPYIFPPCEHHTTGKYQPCGKSKPTPKCVETCKGDTSRDYNKDKHYGGEPRVLTDEKSIQREIMTGGSVSAAIKVYKDFPNYKSGVYVHKEGFFPLGGHAIKIIGWGVENGTPYWLCTNSWNEDWGDKGYFKFLRGSNHCGIEGQVVTSDLVQKETFLYP